MFLKLGLDCMRNKILGNTDYRSVNVVPFSKINWGGCAVCVNDFEVNQRDSKLNGITFVTVN